MARPSASSVYTFVPRSRVGETERIMSACAGDLPRMCVGRLILVGGLRRSPSRASRPATHMAIRIVRLGTPRVAGEGPRLGTVRRPPRGVPKAEFARRDFYDVWLPELSPSAPVVSTATSEPWTPPRWRRFERTYRRE